MGPKRHWANSTSVAAFGFLSAAGIFGISTPKFNSLIIDLSKKKLELAKLEDRIAQAHQQLASVSVKIVASEAEAINQNPEKEPKVVDGMGNYFLTRKTAEKLAPQVSLTELVSAGPDAWLVLKKTTSEENVKHPMMFYYNPKSGKSGAAPLSQTQITDLSREIEKHPELIFKSERLPKSITSTGELN